MVIDRLRVVQLPKAPAEGPGHEDPGSQLQTLGLIQRPVEQGRVHIAATFKTNNIESTRVARGNQPINLRIIQSPVVGFNVHPGQQ